MPQGAGENLEWASLRRFRGHHWNDGLYEALHLQNVPIGPERTNNDKVWLFCLLALGRLKKDDNQDRATDLPTHILGGWIWRNSWPFPGGLFYHPLGQYVLSWENVWNGVEEVLILQEKWRKTDKLLYISLFLMPSRLDESNVKETNWIDAMPNCCDWKRVSNVVFVKLVF